MLYEKNRQKKIIEASEIDKLANLSLTSNTNNRLLVNTQVDNRLSKRNYLRAKRTYEYERMSLDIPGKFHEVLKPFLEKELNIYIRLKNDVTVVSLSLARVGI